MATPKTALQKQQQASQASAVIGGVGALTSQGIGMLNEAKNINTSSPQQKFDAYGRPQFNLGNFIQDTNNIKPRDASGSEIASGALNGASAGSSFGLIGAGVGAVAGAGSAAIFGRLRRNKMRDKQKLAQGNLFSAQQLYNASMDSYNNQQAASSQYQNLTNTAQRMNNLYSYN